jgi:hypothetical protein
VSLFVAALDAVSRGRPVFQLQQCSKQGIEQQRETTVKYKGGESPGKRDGS